MSQYLREGVGGSMWPSMPACSPPRSPGARPRLPPHLAGTHTTGAIHLLSSAWPRVLQHAGMSPHMPNRGLHAPTHQPTPHHSHSHLRTLPLAGLTRGTARVELCVQGSADLAHLDDGPYEAGGEKEQDPRLIPVPANSYFGRDPSLARSHSNPLLLSLVPPSTLPSFCLCLSVSLVLFLPLPLLPSCCSVCLCLRTLWPVLWMSLPWCLPAPPPQGCSL